MPKPSQSHAAGTAQGGKRRTKQLGELLPEHCTRGTTQHQSFPHTRSQTNSREESFPGQRPGKVCKEPGATSKLLAGITSGRWLELLRALRAGLCGRADSQPPTGELTPWILWLRRLWHCQDVPLLPQHLLWPQQTAGKPGMHWDGGTSWGCWAPPARNANAGSSRACPCLSPPPAPCTAARS